MSKGRGGGHVSINTWVLGCLKRVWEEVVRRQMRVAVNNLENNNMENT